MDEMFTPETSPAADLGAPLEGELAFAEQMTEGGNPSFLPLFLFTLPPVVLSVLFEVLKSNTAAMDFWVRSCLAPVIQTIGKFWSIFPFSAAEVIIALGIAALVLWTLRAVVLLVKQRRLGAFLRRLLATVCALAWAWSIFCWSWNSIK